ncbi:MAG: GNAT family N-acetyltransferase [Acidobacteriota bacterium]
MTNHEPRLRALRPADLPQLMDLCAEHAAFEHRPFVREAQAERWRALIFDQPPRLFCWVLEATASDATKADLVGFASCSTEVATWPAAHYLHLDCLYLRPGARGLGLGRRLLQRVARHGLELGCRELQWQTPAWNDRAAVFYRRIGAEALHKLRFVLDEAACRALVAGEAGTRREPMEDPASVDYVPRTASCTGLVEAGGWALKAYTIVRDVARPSDEELQAARDAVAQALPPLPDDDSAPPRERAPRSGFFILHLGEEARWLLVDWWTPGGILCQRMFSAPLDGPCRFEEVPSREILACVWELGVIDFERRAWISTVMRRSGPGREARYHATRFDGAV